jgi:hypothetical protein
MIITAAHVVVIYDVKRKYINRKADKLVIYLGHSPEIEGFKIEIDEPKYGIHYIHHEDYKTEGNGSKNPRDICILKINPKILL